MPPQAAGGAGITSYNIVSKRAQQLKAEDSREMDASMETLLVTGGAGYLGRAVAAAADSWDCHVTTRNSAAAAEQAHRCDLSDSESVHALFDRVRPATVIHTAYGTEAMERDIWAATRNVVDACAATGARLIHMSSDLVLDGERAPYAEDAAPAPVHEYGRWKAKAEDYVLSRLPAAAAVRASLITCFDPPDPRTEWVLAGLRGDRQVTLFVDEVRTPILVGDLAAQLLEIAALDPEMTSGVWHLAAPEALSRYAIGALAAASAGLSAAAIAAGRSREAGAPRPRDVRLLTGRADARLSQRARPLSEAAAEALAARRRLP